MSARPQFGETVKKFQMPQGFSNGFLNTDSSEIMEMFNEMAKLDDTVSKLKSKQANLQRQLNLLG